jgi:quinol monooxygenase YgiN
MTAVVVVATIRPLPEHRAEVIAAMEKTIADVHSRDDGCLLYALLYALHEGDDRLVMIEKWASAEALTEHSRSPALAELNQALNGRLEGGLDVQVLRPHPAGTPAQGTL